MKSAQPRKAAAFHRDPPDLPAELNPDPDSRSWSEESKSVIVQEQRLQDVQALNRKIHTLQIEASVLERVQLAGGQLGSAVWKDTRFAGCDFANLRAHRMTLVRVEFVDCRFTGLATTALNWQDVLIQNGDLRYAQMQGGRFRNCEFAGCDAREADLPGADLTGNLLRSCQLGRADLRGAKLQNTDFRQSEVEGLLVGMNDLRGAIVDPAQAMVFAQVLGLQIR